MDTWYHYLKKQWHTVISTTSFLDKKVYGKDLRSSNVIGSHLDNWNFIITYCLSDDPTMNDCILRIRSVRLRSLHLLGYMSFISSHSCLSCRSHVKLAVYVLFFFPTLNDRTVVVCLSLLYQLLVHTSRRFIHLFCRHVLHSISSSRNSPFMSCLWAWTFSFIWIFFLTDLDKEYRQSPDLYSFDNVTNVVLDRRRKGHTVLLIIKN